mmetsp:Transcript_11500/g.11213  ORF Transcript_11500/g.11213 Transcript_11500/m.11213 type:complete len:201 (-) Transcript_11500:98-700(-)
MSALQTTSNNYESEKCYMSSSNKNNEKKKRQRVVRFSPKVHIKHTISINDMTDEEIANTWIQEEEEYRIRKRCQELIAYADDSSSSSSCYCLRGLESHTKDGMIRKELNRYDSKMLVMDEQDQQYLNDCVDEEKIASVYQEISQQCQLQAERMAQKDRRDAERYYNNMNQNNQSSTTPITTTIRSSTGIITLAQTIASAA